MVYVSPKISLTWIINNNKATKTMEAEELFNVSITFSSFKNLKKVKNKNRPIQRLYPTPIKIGRVTPNIVKKLIALAGLPNILSMISSGSIFLPNWTKKRTYDVMEKDNVRNDNIPKVALFALISVVNSVYAVASNVVMTRNEERGRIKHKQQERIVTNNR